MNGGSGGLRRGASVGKSDIFVFRSVGVRWEPRPAAGAKRGFGVGGIVIDYFPSTVYY